MKIFKKYQKVLSSPFAGSLLGVFASVATTFIVAYAFFKLAGPVPISVSQTTMEKENAFDVTGEGKITAVPDIAEINLGIRVEKNTVTEAQKQANQTINSIEKALKDLKIDKKDIKTTDYRVYPNYNYRGERKITGYTVETNLKIKARDFEKINQVIDQATSLGANQIGQLNFTVDEEKLEEYKNEAREEAVDKAKDKAKNLASISGIKLGKIINVQEGYETPILPRAMGGVVMLEAGEKDEETQIQPGSTEIRVTITLSYEIL